MSLANRRVPALPILLVVTGVLTGWVGAFVLSSAYSRCVDRVRGGECFGRFASDGWHTLGAALLILGAALVVSGVAGAVRSRRADSPLE